MTQQIGITINQPQLNVPLTGLLSLLTAQPATSPAPSFLDLPAKIGDELQGGIYVGPIIEEGKVVHLIAAPETIGSAEWDDAITKAAEYRGGGFDDWLLPSKHWLMTALIGRPLPISLTPGPSILSTDT